MLLDVDEKNIRELLDITLKSRCMRYEPNARLVETHHRQDIIYVTSNDGHLHIDYDLLVRSIYNAGYRRQVEGEWVPYASDIKYGESDETTWYKCSICGEDAHGRCYDDEWYSDPILSDYCPHCGAKMKI